MELVIHLENLEGRCRLLDEVGIKTPFSSSQYGGIPQNLVFNLIGWSLLVLLFTILRRSAGNYGRYAKRVFSSTALGYL